MTEQMRTRSLVELLEDIGNCKRRLFWLRHEYRRSQEQERHRRDSAMRVAASAGLTVTNLAQASELSVSRVRQILKGVD